MCRRSEQHLGCSQGLRRRAQVHEIALVKHQAFKECVGAQNSTRAAPKASDDARGKCMRSRLSSIKSEPNMHMSSYHVNRLCSQGLRRERECMRPSFSSIKSKPSMRMRTNHACALRTAPGLLPRPQTTRPSACDRACQVSKRTKHASAHRTAPGLLPGPQTTHAASA